MGSEDLHSSTSKVTDELRKLRIRTVEGQSGYLWSENPIVSRWVSI